MKGRYGKGRVYKPVGCDVWYIQYWHNRKKMRESSHSYSRRSAVLLLNKRIKNLVKEENVNHGQSIPNEAVIYAFAHCETWLEDYAKSHQLPAHELTGAVAGLLLGQTSGTVLGTFDHLPTLRRASAKRDKATRTLALASGARGKTSRRSNPMKGKKYKKGTHWTQRPENKEKLRRVAESRHAA